MSPVNAISVLDLAQSVIERTILPHFLIDASAAASPKSLWSRMLKQKLTNIYVCTTWYHAGTPFLYEDICIQQIDQLPLLLRTVRKNERIRDLLKRLYFIAYVPNGYTSETRNQLAELASMSPNLSHFSCAAPHYLPSLNIVAPIPFPASITHLHIGEHFSSSLLFKTLTPLSSSLISLSIGLHEHEGTVPAPELTFADLRTLTFTNQSPGLHTKSGFNMADIGIKWKFPRLENLTIQQPWFLLLPILHFCVEHGSNLTYLAILPITYADEERNDPSLRGLWPLLRHCPSLRHLAFEANLCFVPINPDSRENIQPHPSVEWIDIWSSYSGRPGCIGPVSLANWRRSANHEIFPSLKGIRNITAPLLPFISLSQDIPPSEDMAVLSWPWLNDEIDYDLMPHPASRILVPSPPLAVTKLTSFAFEYFEFKFYCDAGRIYQAEHVWPGAGDYDEEEDPTYDPLLDTETPGESDVSDEDDRLSVSSETSYFIRLAWYGQCDDVEMELLSDRNFD